MQGATRSRSGERWRGATRSVWPAPRTSRSCRALSAIPPLSTSPGNFA